MSDLPNIDKNELILTDHDGNDARVDEFGRLQVSQNLQPPENTTPVTQTAYGSVSTTTDTLYTITNGKVLTITNFAAGSESSTAGSVIELYEDPNGNLSVLNPIDIIFASGGSDQHNLIASFTGNGTRRILLRRRRLDGGSKLMFGRWEGYEV